MPIYEYKCDDCGKITELLENAGNKGERKCAHCGSTKLAKRFIWNIRCLTMIVTLIELKPDICSSAKP